MVNEINRAGLNELRRGMELPLWGAESRQTCTCGRTFSTTGQYHECPCGLTWVPQATHDRVMRERRAKETRTANTAADTTRRAMSARDTLWADVERQAAAIRASESITNEAAIARVFDADPALYIRYRTLEDAYRDAKHRQASEQTAEAETLSIIDANRMKTQTPLEREIDELAAPIASEHAISIEQAREHVLRRNPDLQARWIDALVNTQPADNPALGMTERRQRFEATCDRVAKALHAFCPSMTYPQAYTAAINASSTLRRAWAATRRG